MIIGADGLYQVTLKQVEIDIVEFDECQDRLRDTRLGPDFNLHNSFVCGGGKKGIDTCSGDGGGPLVCPSSNGSSEYTQVCDCTEYCNLPWANSIKHIWIIVMSQIRVMFSLHTDWYYLLGSWLLF